MILIKYCMIKLCKARDPRDFPATAECAGPGRGLGHAGCASPGSPGPTLLGPVPSEAVRDHLSGQFRTLQVITDY
eukprot:767192-Hanusia_phi.AAC.1